MKKIKIRKDSITTFFVITSFTAYIGKLITGSDILLAICVFVSFLIPLLMLMERRPLNKKYLISALVSMSIITLFSTFSRSYDVISGFLGLLYIITPCLLCYGVYESKDDLLISNVFFYSFFIYALSFFISIGSSNPDGYNDILSGASRNIVGAIFILLSCFHVAASVKMKGKYPFVIPFISFICCVMLFGRSGIIISLFVLSVCSVNIFNKKYTALLLCIIASVIFYYMFEIQDYIATKTNFAMGAASPRSVMISQYISSIDLEGLLFGNDYQSCCSEIVKFNYNPHNSFIMGHARYGIMYIIVISGLLFHSLTKGRPLSIVLLLVVFSRYFVDQIGLFSPIDFIILYIVFCLPKRQLNKQ